MAKSIWNLFSDRLNDVLQGRDLWTWGISWIWIRPVPNPAKLPDKSPLQSGSNLSIKNLSDEIEFAKHGTLKGVSASHSPKKPPTLSRTQRLHGPQETDFVVLAHRKDVRRAQIEL